MSRDVHSCTHWLRPRNPPPPPQSPAFRLEHEGAIGQQRQTTSLCNPLDLTSWSVFFTVTCKQMFYHYNLIPTTPPPPTHPQ